MGKRKARAVQERPIEGGMEGALEGALEGDGEGSYVEITRKGFFKQPPRPYGTKTAKAKATLLTKRECTLQAQVYATEKMAIANLKKA